MELDSSSNDLRGRVGVDEWRYLGASCWGEKKRVTGEGRRNGEVVKEEQVEREVNGSAR